MKLLRNPILGVTAGVLLLAGCSAGAGSTDTPTTSASTSPAPTTGGEQQPRMGGVSGEIVLAQDGLVQVQNTQSQTAVRYTAATTVQQRVTVALSDIAVGSCVVAIVGDDGTATTVSVSDPVDGACTTGFGGGQRGGQFPGGQGGTRPSGAPTTMPTDGGAPTAMPSVAPSGAPGDRQGGFDGTFVTGTVAAVSGTGLTVTADSGSSDVVVGSTTVLTGSEAADASAIAVGMCLTAQGKADDAGGFDATAITVSTKGADGCSTRGFGGMGRPGANQNGGGNG